MSLLREEATDFDGSRTFRHIFRRPDGTVSDQLGVSVGHSITPGHVPAFSDSEIWLGRPDLAKLMADVAAKAALLGETHVALMICGTGPVVKAVRKLATRKEFGVQFDVHHEVFGFA